MLIGIVAFGLLSLRPTTRVWAQNLAGVSDEAMKIHQSGMLFDGHNDLPWAMRMKADSSFERVDISKPTQFHTDIPRLKAGGLKAQFWSVYVPASTDIQGNALIQTLEQIELVHQMCERYPNVFEMADTAADIERIVKSGKIASMIGVEGGHSIQNSLQVLRELYNRGARYMTLTHSKTLAWADSATDKPRNNGLSPFGKEVVREMNRLGMLVDISHVSDKCMLDAIEVSKAPVIFSHSSARGIAEHPRNVPDNVLSRMPTNGGVVMVNFVSGFIVPEKTRNENRQARGDVGLVCDHIEHVIKVAGIDHVGIGSDFDGVSRLPIGLDDVSTYPRITQELLNRGYNQEQIHKLLGGNVLRVLKQSEKVASNLKNESKPTSESEPIGKLVFDAGDTARTNAIVSQLITPLPDSPQQVTLRGPDDQLLLAQVSQPSIRWGAQAKGKMELNFIADRLPPGKTTFEILSSALNPYTLFEWHDDQIGEATLRYDAQGKSLPVLQYMYRPLDNSSKATRAETYKVFHHAYSHTGRRLTKGPGGLFPHHRGLFFGFNRISYGENQKADVWHCNNGESQTHEKTLAQSSGPLMGRHTVLINWRGRDGKPFAQEIREMTAYRVNNSVIIDFCSDLESLVGKIKLDGDPQHAGFQFRASQEIPDSTKKKTFYIRPDGVAQPGKFRNWSARKKESETNKNHVNLPWNAVCLTYPARSEGAEEPFTIAYLDKPENPKEARFSERDYGRFGSYFEFELDDKKPLKLNYRIQITPGPSTPDQVEEASRNFIDPIQVTN